MPLKKSLEAVFPHGCEDRIVASGFDIPEKPQEPQILKLKAETAVSRANIWRENGILIN